MFVDPTVGMTGAHKTPVNTPDHLAGLFTHLRLRLEHQLCLEIPRLGEMIAFRKVFDRIPPDVAMDEAFVEALVVRRGMQVRYAPDAIVYNTGPDTIEDFVRQRRRNHAGHLYLKSKYGYAVSSIQNTRVAKVALKEIWGVLRLVVDAVLAGRARNLGPPAGVVRLRHQEGPPRRVGHGVVAEGGRGGRAGADRGHRRRSPHGGGGPSCAISLQPSSKSSSAWP